MKFFTKNIFRTIGISLLGAMLLSSCGGGGSCSGCTPTPTPNPTPGSLTLSIEAPSQYPAGLPTTIDAYLTMTNTSNVDATNLVYTIPSPGSAGNYTKVVITPNAGVGSASGDCTNIAAGASCTFIATIGAYASPGSFTVTATPNATVNGQSIKTALTSKALQSSISVTANLGLVDIPNTNNEYYILPSNQTIEGSATDSTIAYISVLIKSAGEGLNSLKLVDETGKELVYESVGNPRYTVNSVNSYKVTIPAGKTIQQIQALSNVCTTLNTGSNNNTACSNNAEVNLAQSGVGILAIQPNYFQMSESVTSQVITLQNVGAGNITNLQLPEIASPFSILSNTCANVTTLVPTASCLLTIGYTAGSSSGEGSYVVNYNNGKSTVNTTVTIPYIGSSPTPTPTPSPSPTPSPTPQLHQYMFVIGGVGGEGSSVLRCELNTSTGAVTSCNVTPDSAAWFTPAYMAFVSVSGNDYAYVNDGSSMYLCSVTEDKNLENCNTIPLDNVPKSPQYMAMNVTEVNGLPYLYTGIVSGSPENYSIYRCPINNDASLGTCENVGFDTTLYGQQESALSLISNMEFVDINNTKYIYMTSALAYSPSRIIPFPGWTGVLRCDVNSSGMLVNCTNFTSTQDIGTSYGLGFNSSGSDLYSYVGNFDSLYYCPVSAVNGDLASCTATPISHSAWKPNSINFKELLGVTYGYVVNTSGGETLEYCTLNNNGSINVCNVTAPPEFPSWAPVATFVQTVE